MRILHIGDALPDVRIERFMDLDRTLHHESGFCGQLSNPVVHALNLGNDIQAYNLDITRSFRLGRFTTLQIKQFAEIFDLFDPDIIQAHDIYFLNFLMTFYKKTKQFRPFVYNDHEYLSKQMNILVEAYKSSLSLLKATKSYYKYLLFKRWEKKYIPNQTVMTVSKRINDHHKDVYTAKFSSFIPNMPTRREIEAITLSTQNQKTSAVYIGNDFSVQAFPPRFIGNLYQMWMDKKPAHLILIGDNKISSNKQIESVGVIPHMSLYTYASKAHYGILPFLPHDFHKYGSPNKIYMYLHAGALPILPRGFDFALDVPRFSDFHELFDILRNFPVPDPIALRKLAKETVVADVLIDRLKQAYESALSNS